MVALEEGFDSDCEGAGEEDFVSSFGGDAVFFSDLGALSSGGIASVERSSSASARTPILEPTATPLAPSSTCYLLLEIVALR